VPPAVPPKIDWLVADVTVTAPVLLPMNTDEEAAVPMKSVPPPWAKIVSAPALAVTVELVPVTVTTSPPVEAAAAPVPDEDVPSSMMSPLPTALIE
jgi:hypothetical protein